MKILLLNSILYTAEKNIIPNVDSIKDCMIYSIGIAFKKLGHDVTLIAAEDYKPQLPENYDFNIVFQKTLLKKIFLPSVLPFQLDLISYLRKNGKQFDMIISSEVFSFSSLFAVLFCKKNLIIWQELNVHNRKFHKIPSFLWYNCIGRLFFRNTLIVPRSDSASVFIQKYCNNVSSIIVDHGVDLTKFAISRIKEKQFIVVSQLIKRKQIDYIIQQFYFFVQEYPDEGYKLLIAGRGNEEDSLKKMTEQLNLTERIRFLGFLEHAQLNKYVSMSVAFLIATEQDLNMVSIPESIVSGTPILTNSVPALSSFIKNKSLGIVRDNWGVNELKKMIEMHLVFSDNCLSQRNELSSENAAKKLINAFLNDCQKKEKGRRKINST